MCAIFHNANRGSHIQFPSVLLLPAILIHCVLTFLCTEDPGSICLTIKKMPFWCSDGSHLIDSNLIQMTAEIWHTGRVVIILAGDFPPSFQCASQSQPFVRPWTRFFQESLCSIPLYRSPSLPPRCAPFINPFCQSTGIHSHGQPH